MPTIQFQNDGLDGLRVLSTMYFPQAEDDRALLFHDFAAQVGATVQPQTARAELTMREASRWTLKVSEAAWRGTVAGEGLLRLALLYESGHREPSMRKVVASLQAYAIDLRTDPESGDLGDSREDRAIAITWESMRNYLRAFKSVSHLWAAHRILDRTCSFFMAPNALCDESQLDQFLAHAEWFLIRGESHKTRYANAPPTLDRATAWIPSVSVEGAKPDLGAWPTSLIDAVENYRAE